MGARRLSSWLFALLVSAPAAGAIRMGAIQNGMVDASSSQPRSSAPRMSSARPGWPAGAPFEECLTSVSGLPEDQARALRLGALRRLTVVSSLTALQRLAALQERNTLEEEDIVSWAEGCEAQGFTEAQLSQLLDALDEMLA